MQPYIWRCVIAAVIVIFLFLAIPLLFEIVEFPLGVSLWALIRLCIAALAVLYVFTGKPAISG